MKTNEILSFHHPRLCSVDRTHCSPLFSFYVRHFHFVLVFKQLQQAYALYSGSLVLPSIFAFHKQMSKFSLVPVIRSILAANKNEQNCLITDSNTIEQWQVYYFTLTKHKYDIVSFLRFNMKCKTEPLRQISTW